MKKEVINFIIIGVVNTIFYYAMYSFFIYLDLNYKIAVLLATIFGVIFNFKTFGKYVFNNSNNRLILKFIMSYVVLYFINLISIKLFNIIVENLYIAGFLAIFPNAILSFMLNKFYVFKK